MIQTNLRIRKKELDIRYCIQNTIIVLDVIYHVIKSLCCKNSDKICSGIKGKDDHHQGFFKNKYEELMLYDFMLTAFNK